MEIREDLERKLASRRKELADLELRIREKAAYVRALEDTLQMLDASTGKALRVRSVRPESDVGKSAAALRKAGKPLHISELLDAIGKADSKKNRVSLVGTLAGYVRRNHVFTRPGPNTFALIDWEPKRKRSKAQARVPHIAEEPPDDFGSMTVRA